MCRKSVLLVVALSLILASAVQAVDPSLVAWWKLNETEGTTATDASGNGNDGTLQGDAAWTEDGYWDGAVLLDGDGDYVDCGSGNIYNIRDAVTLAAWVHADPDFAYPDWSGIIMRGGDPYDTFALYYNGNDPQIGFKLTETTAEWHATAAPGLFDREWHHVSATWDGQTKIIYLDASVLMTVDSSGQIQTSNGRLLLGAGRDLDPPTHPLAGRIDDARIYDRALSQLEIQAVMLDPGATELAVDPIPADGQTDVLRDVVLGWTAGEFAGTHDVYLGTDLDDVNNASRANPMGVLVSQGQDDTTYEPDTVLEFGQTYYWRIDEVNATPDNAIFKGDLWSFTIEPFGYPIAGVVATSNAISNAGEGPERTVDGSGLNDDDEHSVDAPDMWLGLPGDEPVQIQFEFNRVYKLHELLVWNYNVLFELVLGFGLKDVTVEYSENGTDWTVLGDVQFAQATAMADYTANTVVDMAGATAQYVRLTVNSGHGSLGQFGLSEVRFLYTPVQAREPQPADGSVAVDVAAILSWRAGRQAAAHDVYLGTAPDTLALADTTSDSSYTQADLQFGTTYHWRIDEVNEAETPAIWQGDLWSFTTLEFLVVDDMESYDDEENTIFDTWLDGFVNETGSTVGYFDAPFAEQTIVNGGKQSMPFEYDNTAAPFYSEAELDLGSANWTTNGVDTLRLFVYGQEGNSLERLYVAIEDTSGNVAVVANPDAGATGRPGWNEWRIPLDDFAGVNLSRVAMMYLGVGDRDSPTAGGSGTIFIDDIGAGHPASP